MILPVSLAFGHVTIATSTMTFYDCGAVSRLNQSSQYVRTQQASNPAVSNVTSLNDGGVFQMFGLRRQRVELQLVSSGSALYS